MKPSFMWLEPAAARELLRTGHRQTNRLVSFTDTTINDLLCDLWAADCSVSPPPLVGAATLDDGIAGIMAVTAWPSECCDHIDVFALPLDHPQRQMVAQRLLEAACDQSLEDGYYGWVSCHPTPKTTSFWAEQKFARHDDESFRRLGYFA